MLFFKIVELRFKCHKVIIDIVTEEAYPGLQKILTAIQRVHPEQFERIGRTRNLNLEALLTSLFSEPQIRFFLALQTQLKEHFEYFFLTLLAENNQYYNTKTVEIHTISFDFGLELEEGELHIPPEIIKFPKVRRISFAYVYKIFLPPKLASNLQTLELVHCGAIIPSGIYNHVRNLICGDMRKKEFPLSINVAYFPALTRLTYSGSDLETVPSAVFKMPLEFINFDQNQIQKIEPGIAQCLTLRSLSFRNNLILHLPPDLDNFPTFLTITNEKGEIEQRKITLKADFASNYLNEFPLFACLKLDILNFSLSWFLPLARQLNESARELSLYSIRSWLMGKKKYFSLPEQAFFDSMLLQVANENQRLMLKIAYIFDAEQWLEDMQEILHTIHRELITIRGIKEQVYSLIHVNIHDPTGIKKGVVHRDLGQALGEYSPSYLAFLRVLNRYPYRQKFIEQFIQQCIHEPLDPLLLQFFLKFEGVTVKEYKIIL